jgi:hypothetical protein
MIPAITMTSTHMFMISPTEIADKLEETQIASFDST